MKVYFFTNLFVLLFFLLVFCISCKNVWANSNQLTLQAQGESVTYCSEDNKCKVVNITSTSYSEIEVTPKEYYFPLFVSAGDIIFALVEVNNNINNDKSITVLTRYVDTKEKLDWREKIINKDGVNGWKPLLGVKKEIKSDNTVVTTYFATATVNEIFLLLVNCSNNKAEDGASTETVCDFEVVIGTILQSEPNEKKISWKKPESPIILNYKLGFLLENVPNCRYFSFRDAFLINDNEVIFVLKIKTVQNKDKTVLISFKNKEKKFDLVPVNELSEECHQYIFPWKKKIIQLTTHCKKDGEINIKESNNIKGEWRDVKGPLSSLFNFFKDKNDFITATTNNNKEFILFTQKIEEAQSDGKKNFLLISDGTRATIVGEITTDSKDTVFNKLIYIKDELFLFTEIYEKGIIKTTTLARLEEHTTKIKNVLNAWDSEKNDIHQLCTVAVPSEVYCNTDGLVGFLLNKINISNDLWQDEYYYKNATIKIGNKVADSITFKGKNEGAKWLVEDKKKDQEPHNFFDPGFTLVTTLTVEKEIDGSYNSILGVVFAENKKPIDFLCSTEKKWVMRNGEDETKIESTNESCDYGNTYQVVLIFEKKSGELTVYINGNRIDNFTTKNLQLEKNKNILYFYFGANEKHTNDDTHITIKNVLLYNHPFNSKEIFKLEVKKQEKTKSSKNKSVKSNIPEQQNRDDGPEVNKYVVENNAGGDEFTSATITEEVVPSSTQQKENAVVNSVSVVCSVLYLVFVMLVISLTATY